MAAPADKRTRLCDKCFATVEAGAPYCPECGAPMDGSPSTESSDSAIYPQLARANLLRMRGEYKQAEDVCLGILKRLPNNASAHTLLADICAERGDLEQAVEWYELSLDITPDSKVERAKLTAVKQRIHDRDAAATAEQIGLPAKQPKFVLPIVAVVVIIAVIGIAAFFLGQKTEQIRKRGPVVDVSSGNRGAQIDVGNNDNTQEPTDVQNAAPMPAWHDAQFTRFLADQIEDGRRISDAWQDPRTQAVAVTISATKDENVRQLAATFGSSVLAQAPNASTVTVRVVQDGKLVFVGDVERGNWVQATSDAWKTEHPDDPAATTDLLLSNEWPAAPEGNVTPPNPTTGNGGGEAAPTTGSTGTTPPDTTGQ